MAAQVQSLADGDSESSLHTQSYWMERFSELVRGSCLLRSARL